MVELPDWAQRLWEPSRFKALKGGRGGGKSRSIATALVLQAAAEPHRILCAREVQKSIKDSVKRLLDDEIARLGLGSFFESVENEIRGKNGSLFIFAGLRNNIASIKSIEGLTRVWVEEAQTISQESLNVLTPTVRQEGSEIWFSFNPKQADDPIDRMFCGPDGPPPNSIVLEVNYYDNPWFPSVLADEMEYDKRRDPDKYAHVWLGKYQSNSESRVFRNWKVSEFDTDPSWTIRQGADWGFSIDPTVLIQVAIVGRTLYIIDEAYRIGVEIVDTPAFFMTLVDAEKWPMTADSSRPETISHLRKHGFPKIMPAVKGARSVEEGVEWLKSHDIIVHPRCQHTIDELTMYQYETDPLTGQVLPRLKDKDNHVIDALRYACEGARRAQTGKPAAVTLVPTMNHFGRR